MFGDVKNDQNKYNQQKDMKRYSATRFTRTMRLCTKADCPVIM